MQRVVTGRAFRRLYGMSPPQRSHVPYVAVSIRSRASSIFLSSFRSRSRIRMEKFWSTSADAWSLTSGNAARSPRCVRTSPTSFRMAARWRSRSRRMSGYLDFRTLVFDLLTERLALAEPCDFVEEVRVLERRFFMAEVLRVKQTAHYTNLYERGSTRVETSRMDYKSRRPSIDFSNVTSSAYSISMPTGIPYAIRETRTPKGLSNRVK